MPKKNSYEYKLTGAIVKTADVQNLLVITTLVVGGKDYYHYDYLHTTSSTTATTNSIETNNKWKVMSNIIK